MARRRAESDIVLGVRGGFQLDHGPMKCATRTALDPHTIVTISPRSLSSKTNFSRDLAEHQTATSQCPRFALVRPPYFGNCLRKAAAFSEIPDWLQRLRGVAPMGLARSSRRRYLFFSTSP